MSVDPELDEQAEEYDLVRLLRVIPVGAGSVRSELLRADGDGQVTGVSFRAGGIDPLVIDEHFDWLNLPYEDRSWQWPLQAWIFMRPALTAYVKTGSRECLNWAVAVGLRWWSQNRSLSSSEAGMAWYDMSVGVRAPLLAFLVLAACREGYPKHEIDALRACAGHHREVFESSDIYNPRTNHGYFVAAGQTAFSDALSALPGMRESNVVGRKRLAHMIETQFADDGGHREHSPDYHRMIVECFQSAMAAGYITSDAAIERLERSVDALDWMVQPDGTLTQFGDSPAKTVVGTEKRAEHYTASWMRTRGRVGSPPPGRMLVMPETGYVFARPVKLTHFGDLSESGYLAIQAGFHSRAHKHADDLSFVWWVSGIPVLVDAGRFGYGELLPAKSPLRKEGFYYADPRRRYVESTLAHNTLAVDGRIQNRRRPPYGSGLREWSDSGEEIRVRAVADHSDWHHERTWIYCRDDTLTVTDAVTFEHEDVHRLDQWWHLDGNLGVVPGAAGEVTVRGTSGLVVHIEQDGLSDSGGIARGLEDPLRGWRSLRDRELVPSWSIGWSGSVQRQACVTTRFTVLGRPGK